MSMTLCLGQSLIDCRGAELQDQAEKYVAWSQDGCMSSVPERGRFDIGIGTQSVLRVWTAHSEHQGPGIAWLALARVVADEGQKAIDYLFQREAYCGNESPMLVIPVALTFYAAGVEKAIHHRKESSKITYPHSRCREGCVVPTKFVVLALQAQLRASSLRPMVRDDIQDDQLRNRLSTWKSLDDWRQQIENNIRSTGYTIDPLGPAFWAYFIRHIRVWRNVGHQSRRRC